MKKTSFFASAFALALIVGAASCSSKNSAKDEGDSNVEKTEGTAGAVKQTPVSEEARPTALAASVRYIDTQKISASYAPALEVAKADSAAQVKLASYQTQLGNDLQKKQKAIEDKQARNGYLTQESFNADVADLQKAQQEAERKLMQRQREYAVEIANKQEAVLDSIHNVITYLSDQYGLDMVIDRSSGYYFNSALDMTDDVIAELNKRLGK